MSNSAGTCYMLAYNVETRRGDASDDTAQFVRVVVINKNATAAPASLKDPMTYPIPMNQSKCISIPN